MTHIESFRRTFARYTLISAIVACVAPAFGQGLSVAPSSGLGVLGLASSLGSMGEEQLASLDFASQGDATLARIDALESSAGRRPTGVRARPGLPGEATPGLTRPAMAPSRPASTSRSTDAGTSRSPAVGGSPAAAPIRPSVKAPIRPASEPTAASASPVPSRSMVFSGLSSGFRRN